MGEAEVGGGGSGHLSSPPGRLARRMGSGRKGRREVGQREELGKEGEEEKETRRRRRRRAWSLGASEWSCKLSAACCLNREWRRERQESSRVCTAGRTVLYGECGEDRRRRRHAGRQAGRASMV